MILAIYVGAFVALCIACGAVWKRESRSRIILTPFLMFCANEVIRVWPAAIYARYAGISDGLYPTFVILSGTFAFVIGYVVAGDLIGWSKFSPLAFHMRPMMRATAGAHLIATGVCATLLVLAALYFYQGLPPTVHSFTRLITEGYSGGVAGFAAQEREKYTKSHYFGGEYRGQGVIREYTAIGWPLLATISLLLYLQRKSPFQLALTLALVVASLVFVAGDGTRGTFLWAMISLVITLSLVVKMRATTLLTVGAVLLMLLLGLSSVKKFAGYAAEGTFLKSGAKRIAERIFVGNGVNTVHVIELVNCGRLDLRRGTIHRTEMLNSLPSIRVGKPFSYDLYQILNPHGEGTTYCTMTYLGRLYGDFGWPGAAGGFFLAGIFTSLMTRFLFSRRKTVLNTAIIGALLMRLGNLDLNGPFTIVSSTVVILSVGALYTVVFGIAHQCEQAGTGSLTPRQPNLQPSQ